MSTRANYFKLGLFVIAAMVGLGGAIVFFGGRMLMQEVVYMETYLNESVEGLEVGSPVNYRGVRIGRVDRIGFVANDYDIEPDTPEFDTYGGYVRVVLAIENSGEGELDVSTLLSTLAVGKVDQVGKVPKKELRIRLKTHALTGVAYLDADYLDPHDYAPMAISWKPRTPYLPSAPSVISTFTTTAEDAFRKLGRIDIERMVDVTEKLIVTLEQAVSDADVAQVSKDVKTLLATLDEAVKDADVAQVSSDLKKLIATAGAAVKDARIGEVRQGVTDLLASANTALKEAQIANVSRDVRSLLAELRQTNTSLQALVKAPDGAPAATLNRTLANLDKVIVRMDLLLRREGPTISRTAADIATAAEQLKKLVDDLERNPARLLFGAPPAKPRKVNP